MKRTISFFFLLTLLSSMKIQARDSQFFNKVSSDTTNVVPNHDQPAAATTTSVAPNKDQPLNNNQQQEPNFLPANENGYGLEGHESGQLPPYATATTTTTAAADSTNAVPEEFRKYLPKNYNPVAYVTEPAHVDESNSFSEDTFTTNSLNSNENNHNDAQYYNDNRLQQEYQTGKPEYRSYTANTYTANNRYSNDDFNYNGGSDFNSGPQGLSDTRFMGGATQNRGENDFYNGDEESSFQPQGMSDTRSLENGKYYYDINIGKYSGNHPYESLKGVRVRNEYNNDRNYNGNSYQNQYEFPSEQNLP
ncbi:hypothetical protein F511_21483 [Dorcoceras hygrometricum]|uniref:Protein E6 n=1 Tax=Dorcoceras hygrometricum TaxID=472368 RepID=A0A2Z7D812_9LAMI|nr:hypothetical protein F511_21483 [Dorcoceras hygrometricum]